MLRWATVSLTVYSILDVDSSCIFEPLTCVWIRTACGSVRTDAETIQGPMGSLREDHIRCRDGREESAADQVSRFLPIPHCFPCRIVLRACSRSPPSVS